MYHVYIKEDNVYGAKKLVGEFNDLDDAYDKADELKEDNKKYVIEETTGHVDNYGELIVTVVEEN